MQDDFGDRMKRYEKSQVLLIANGEPVFGMENGNVNPNLPVFIRLDGKAFHTYTKNFRKTFEFDELEIMREVFSENEKFDKPFDKDLSIVFQKATLKTCENIGQIIMAYGQSDEVTFLLNGWQKPESQIYFGGKIQKIVSVISSIFTGYFNYVLESRDYPAVFDARVWNVPVDEVENVFIWRQKDARRNSVSGLAQSLYSHKELQGKSTKEMMHMCYNERGEDWNELSNLQKWGFVVHNENYYIDMADGSVERSRWKVDNSIPYFVDDRNYISGLVNKE